MSGAIVTSGSYATVQMDMAKMFEHVCRRCRISPTVAAEDHAQAFIDIVNMLTASLANRGALLWTLTPFVLGFNPGVGQYAMPSGAEDVVSDGLFRTVVRESGGIAASSAGGTATNAFDGDLDTACTQTAPNGNLSYQFTEATRVLSVGVVSNGNANYTLAVEVSNDGVTWTEVLDTGLQSYVDRYPRWFDIAAPASAGYVRVRETGGAILNVREVVFATQINEVPIARISLDQYNNYPNKSFQSTFVNSFYVDKQVPNLITYVWPVPQDFTTSLFVRMKRLIMSVPGFTDDDGNDIMIELPQRWHLAMIKGLAREFARELPEVTEDLIARLDKDYVLDSLPEAESAERDPTPTYLTPNLRPYTA